MSPAAASSTATVAQCSAARACCAICVLIIAVFLAHDSASVRAAPTATAAVTTTTPATATAAASAQLTAPLEPDPRPAALHAPHHLGGGGPMHRATVTAVAVPAPPSTAEGGVGGSSRVDNVTRLHGGDVFNAYDAESCITDTCVGLSSGTAGLFPKNDLNDARKYRPDAVDCRCQCLPHLSTFREDLNICVDDVHECTLAPFVSGSTAEKIPFVFLPLRGQIIHPSKEISFQGVKSPICAVSGAQYLATAGWMELRNPIDSDVPFRLFRDEGRTFLQWLGEADLRHKMQGRLVLVHLMCRDMAAKSTAAENVAPPDSGGYATGQSALAHQNIFSPCVAFRVVGQPVKMTNNVTEVSFQPETQATAAASSIGLSTKEYIAITVCSLLLGLIYVASVLLYLYVKKRKSGRPDNDSHAVAGAAAGPTAAALNEQVTFGTGFSRTSSLQSAFGGKIRDGNAFSGDARRESLRSLQQQAAAAAVAASVSGGNAPPGYGRHGSGGGLPSGVVVVGVMGDEMGGVVKNNPLLKHYPNFDGSVEFPSDMSASNSECGDADGDIMHRPMQQQQQQLQRMHHHVDMVDGVGMMMMGKKTNTLSYSEGGDEYDNDAAASSGGETECLPEENVSIVEEHLSPDDKLENMKAIVNGTLRRKLYFNPAYFEPHLLMSPPAAAIEFLNKIREVISIAKYKMASKRYQPSLNVIHEEGGGGGAAHHLRYGGADAPTPTESEAYQLHGSAHRTGSTGMQTPSSQLSRCKSSASSGGTNSCVGCPGCAAHAAAGGADPSAAAHNNRADCRNCGDKRNSIRRWLEDVSTHELNTKRGSVASDADADNEHNILDRLLDMPLLDAHADPDGPHPNEMRQSAETKRSADSSGSDTDTIKANSLDSKRSPKRMAPAAPTAAHHPTVAAVAPTPKIISHYLKQEICKPNEHQQLEINNNTNNANMMRHNGVGTGGQPFRDHNTKIYDKMELFTQLTQTAVVGELFNNPQFKHHPAYDPPTPFSGGLSSTPSKTVTAVGTDGGTGPPASDYELMQSLKQQMPDMIYEAMAKDYSKRKIIANLPAPPAANHQHHHHGMLMPHPDYDDSSLSKKYDDIPSYVHVPTPDYNTFGRSKNNPQPDSPIYKRKSPHHLIVDYETDSLERNSTAHRRHGQPNHTPTTTPATTMPRTATRTTMRQGGLNGGGPSSTGASTTSATTTTGGSSSEASSQPSPSMSTALPLEEEVEVRHTVYDRAEGYRKDGLSGGPANSAADHFAGRISFANLLHLSGGGGPPALPAKQPRIQYNTPSHGSMTIEVEHSPSEYEQSTDSEQFEPDTLDRKAARRSSVSSMQSGAIGVGGIGQRSAIVNLWSQHLTRSQCDVAQAALRHSSLDNISSLPADVSTTTTASTDSQLYDGSDGGGRRLVAQPQQPQLVLRSSGSFKSNSLSNFAALNVQASHAEPRLQKNFNSLREIYEAKNLQTSAASPSPSPSHSVHPTVAAAAATAAAAAAALEREREQGRLLTLEARHSRRQRQTGGVQGTLKKPVPPDVVPNGNKNTFPGTQSIYDMPKTPATRAKPGGSATVVKSTPSPSASHYELYQTNLTGWTSQQQQQHSQSGRTSTTTSNTNTNTSNTTATTSDEDDDDDGANGHQRRGDDRLRGQPQTASDTRSNSSESTEVTGVSDTQLTSDSDARRMRRQRRANGNNATSAPNSQQSSAARKYSKVNKGRPPPPPLAQQQPPIEILNNFMSIGGGVGAAAGPAIGDLSDFSDTSTIKSGSTNFLYQSSARSTAAAVDDELDKIEIVSSKSLSVHSVPLSRDQGGESASHSDYEQMQQQQHHHQQRHQQNLLLQQQLQQQQQQSEPNNNDSASINHEQLLYDLTSPANRFHYAQPSPTATNTRPSSATSIPSHHHHHQQQQQQLTAATTTKVFRCEVNPSSHGMQIALGLKDRVKKTKDLKYAWKRFVNIATAKFHVASPTGTGSGRSTSKSATDTTLDDGCRLSALSDGDEGIASIHADDSLLVHVQATAAAGQVSRTPSINSERSRGARSVAHPQRNDPDSGYMSADSSESKLNSKRLYERFNFRGSKTSTVSAASAAASASDEPSAASGKRMQDITESTSELEAAVHLAQHSSGHQKPSVTGFIPKRATTPTGSMAASGCSSLLQPIDVNVFSSDDEKFSSDDMSTDEGGNGVDGGGDDEDDEDDDDEDDEDGRFGAGLDDDMCGSGAESVETNSVFFKNVRKAAPK